MRIEAVILAAGESKRMRSSKMLLPFMGRTIIECVIRNTLASEVDSATVVTGGWKEDIGKVIGRYDINIVFNENYGEGMLSSVRCGIRSLPAGCDAALVIPGDMPLITGDVINEVINSYITSAKRIIIPVCKGRRGHPILVASDLFGEINRLDENEGLRQLAQWYPGDIYETEIANDAILKDIDTITEYRKEINSN